MRKCRLSMSSRTAAWMVSTSSTMTTTTTVTRGGAARRGRRLSLSLSLSRKPSDTSASRQVRRRVRAGQKHGAPPIKLKPPFFSANVGFAGALEAGPEARRRRTMAHAASSRTRNDLRCVAVGATRNRKEAFHGRRADAGRRTDGRGGAPTRAR